MRDDQVPRIFRVAGKEAVHAYREFFEYREFLDDATLNDKTRAFRLTIGRFARWAEGRGLALKTITAEDLAFYVAEIAKHLPAHRASVALAVLSGLFRHLAGSGVISANPFEPRRSSRKPRRDGIRNSRLEAREGDI